MYTDVRTIMILPIHTHQLISNNKGRCAFADVCWHLSTQVPWFRVWSLAHNPYGLRASAKNTSTCNKGLRLQGAVFPRYTIQGLVGWLSNSKLNPEVANPVQSNA